MKKTVTYVLVADGALSGDWSTAGLMTPNGKNQAGVSHISFYNSAAPVPPGEGAFSSEGLVMVCRPLAGGDLQHVQRPRAGSE